MARNIEKKSRKRKAKREQKILRAAEKGNLELPTVSELMMEQRGLLVTGKGGPHSTKKGKKGYSRKPKHRAKEED